MLILTKLGSKNRTMAGFVLRSTIAFQAVVYVVAEGITLPPPQAVEQFNLLESAERVLADSKTSFLARAGDPGILGSILNAHRKKMELAATQDTKDLLPPVFDKSLSTNGEQVNQAVANGKQFSEKAKAQFTANDDQVCKQMASWSNWYWSKKEFDDDAEIRSSKDTSAAQKDEAEAMWAGQSKINEAWQTEACKDISGAQIKTHCRNVAGAEKSFETVCNKKADGSSCCR